MSDKPPPYQSPQGYAAPQQGYAAPQQGYAAPQQGYAAPQHGYAPSQHGYAPPPQGYATPPQGYGPPPQEYFPHPPQHVYNTHHQGYAPGMHSSHSSTTVVVGGGMRTAPVVVTPVHERFADKILLNLLISLIFWPWVIVWLFMCAFEKRV
uniref:Uncharacterized protein n=1 Tax=Magallana gigas TaxID=29159 RepID=A0A8W8IM84_MAGGI